MPKYNPNSIWKSPKKEEDVYTPTQPKQEAKSVKDALAEPAGKAAPAAAQTTAAPGGVSAEPFFKKSPAAQFDEPRTEKGHMLLWSVIVFVVLLGSGVLYFFLRPTPGPSVSIGFTNPNQGVLVGDPFTLQVNLANNSNVALSGATLSLTLPQGISLVGASNDPRIIQTSTGDIAPGSIDDQTFSLIATNDANSVQQIVASLAYMTSSSKALYDANGSDNLIVGGPAITLSFNAPAAIFSGQNFQVPISYTNNTTHSFNNVELTLQYPSGGAFSFQGSTMQPDSAANNSWNLGTIPAAGNGTITITGNIVGSANASYAINGNLMGSVAGNTYTLTNSSANLVIGSSPLSLTAVVNNDKNYVAKTADTLNYTITYTNNSSVTFQNVTITAGLVGALYDLATVTSNGSFSSLTNAITWNAANTPALLNVAPGATGSVTFTVRTKPTYPVSAYKDYTLQMNARIASATVPPGTAASSTVSATSISNDVGGAISLVSEAFHGDPSSGISNTGPYPPKVNRATQYTIHWIITNYATDAKNVTVSAYLQSGTTCTGVIKATMPGSASTTAPTCNAANGLITWNIPVVPAMTGVADAPAEAVIQVTNTPASNELGGTVTLLGPTTLTATDGFTSSTLQASASDLTTQLPDDRSIPSSVSRNVTQ
jgi:hypothetical protein